METTLKSDLAVSFLEAKMSLALTGHTDLTLSPECARTMHYMGRIMRSPNIPMVTVDDLDSAGFRGWWSSVDSLLCTFEADNGNIHL